MAALFWCAFTIFIKIASSVLPNSVYLTFRQDLWRRNCIYKSGSRQNRICCIEFSHNMDQVFKSRVLGFGSGLENWGKHKWNKAFLHFFTKFLPFLIDFSKWCDPRRRYGILKNHQKIGKKWRKALFNP